MTKKTEFQHILVGVDDSEDALLAFRYAIATAKQRHAALTIVSIREDSDVNVFQAMDKDYIHGERSELEEHINTYVQQAKDAGVEQVNAVVSEGKPAEVIVKDVIPHVKPDVLIIGSIAKKGLKRRVGSQAAYMAKYAPISVLVIR
ncbi:universal stress protein UspA [Secundilactobacillus pentosiphilus]|uniref:Universal stress protein UspA n=1 Tax=Secundilactobacillus pentosiphilus TaxID=1714682 RepID=A0A1Z5IT78_9LACO|nr:universal stress protein [Secundilactobacillus pentosiphilus]GAX04975.1 universal stress protein UspA [Secundilactobacillus pentosiphilus]